MASSSSSSTFPLRIQFTCILLLLLTSIQYAIGCYKSIISFGDSLADTGNLLHMSHSNKPPHFALPPYGETYFHRPTGRFSDGRLVIDFIAEYFELPFIAPYMGDKNESNTNFREGVNFAVGGATALEASFYEERGIHNPDTNNSLGIQLGWFKELLQSLCGTSSSDCSELLQNSLVLVGEIGGNDYNHGLLVGRSIEEIQSFVPPVVNAIASAINELIELGAVTLMVPGNLPIGCSVAYLTYFKSPNEEEYDPITGCLIWLNKFAEYHNKLLETELNRIRELHPHATIIYADYYNAAMQFYRSANYFGFTGGAVRACCGGGGPYNYNSSELCGYPPSTVCDDPSLYVNWDGLHLTEAAYRWISEGLLEGPYTIPPISTSCISVSVKSGYSDYNRKIQ